MVAATVLALRDAAVRASDAVRAIRASDAARDEAVSVRAIHAAEAPYVRVRDEIPLPLLPILLMPSLQFLLLLSSMLLQISFSFSFRLPPCFNADRIHCDCEGKMKLFCIFCEGVFLP